VVSDDSIGLGLVLEEKVLEEQLLEVVLLHEIGTFSLMAALSLTTLPYVSPSFVNTSASSCFSANVRRQRPSMSSSS
jgi:hypothetical protein